MNITFIAHIFYWLYLLFNFILFLIIITTPNFDVINTFIIIECINFTLLSIITIITINNQLYNIQTFENKYSTFGMFIYYFIFNISYFFLNSLLLTYKKNIVLQPVLIMFLMCNYIYGGLHYLFLTANIDNNTISNTTVDTSIEHPYIEISDITRDIEQ